jgi:hypothetical protein
MKSGADYKRLGFEEEPPELAEEEQSAAASITAIAASPRSQAQVAEERSAKEAALREMLMESEWGGEDYDVALIEEVIASAMESDTNMEQDETLRESAEPPAMGILRQGSMTGAKVHYGIKAEEDLEQIWKPHQSPLIDLLYDDDVVKQRRHLFRGYCLRLSVVVHRVRLTNYSFGPLE